MDIFKKYLNKCITTQGSIDSIPKITGGLWIKGKILDDKIWEWILDGRITAYSWAGIPKHDEVIDIEGKRIYILHKADILDISVVVSPADLHAQIKIEDKENHIISGYASTSRENRRYEFIMPSVFKTGMEQYMSMPPKGVILFNHNQDKPVGKILEYRVIEKKKSDLFKEESMSDNREVINNIIIESMNNRIDIVKGQKGKGGSPEGDGGSDYCYCPKCNYKVKHERGEGQGKAVPCAKLKCPKCGASLIGSKEMERLKKKNKEKK